MPKRRISRISSMKPNSRYHTGVGARDAGTWSLTPSGDLEYIKSTANIIPKPDENVLRLTLRTSGRLAEIRRATKQAKEIERQIKTEGKYQVSLTDDDRVRITSQEMSRVRQAGEARKQKILSAKQSFLDAIDPNRLDSVENQRLRGISGKTKNEIIKRIFKRGFSEDLVSTYITDEDQRKFSAAYEKLPSFGPARQAGIARLEKELMSNAENRIKAKLTAKKSDTFSKALFQNLVMNDEESLVKLTASEKKMVMSKLGLTQEDLKQMKRETKGLHKFSSQLQRDFGLQAMAEEVASNSPEFLKQRDKILSEMDHHDKSSRQAAYRKIRSARQTLAKTQLERGSALLKSSFKDSVVQKRLERVNEMAVDSRKRKIERLHKRVENLKMGVINDQIAGQSHKARNKGSWEYRQFEKVYRNLEETKAEEHKKRVLETQDVSKPMPFGEPDNHYTIAGAKKDAENGNRIATSEESYYLEEIRSRIRRDASIDVGKDEKEFLSLYNKKAQAIADKEHGIKAFFSLNMDAKDERKSNLTSMLSLIKTSDGQQLKRAAQSRSKARMEVVFYNDASRPPTLAEWRQGQREGVFYFNFFEFGRMVYKTEPIYETRVDDKGKSKKVVVGTKRVPDYYTAGAGIFARFQTQVNANNFRAAVNAEMESLLPQSIGDTTLDMALTAAKGYTKELGSLILGRMGDWGVRVLKGLTRERIKGKYGSTGRMENSWHWVIREMK